MLFDAREGDGGGGLAAPATAVSATRVAARRWRLRCRPCGHLLAAPAWRVRVDGAERHVQTNPLGLRFVLRLYEAAPGCRAGGRPTTAHSWFPPLAWQTLACGGCGAHCGWQFARGDVPGFVALIVDGIVEEVYE